jgi:hypothetical protein
VEDVGKIGLATRNKKKLITLALIVVRCVSKYNISSS